MLMLIINILGLLCFFIIMVLIGFLFKTGKIVNNNHPQWFLKRKKNNYDE